MDGRVARLFEIIEANPRNSVEALKRVAQQRHALRKRVVQTVLKIGKGPKHICTLAELRQAVSFQRGPAGRAPFPGADPEALTTAILALEKERAIRLEGAVDLSNLSSAERKAGIKCKERGLLAYAAPGPRAPKRV